MVIPARRLRLFSVMFGVLLLAREGAPRVWEGLSQQPFALALHAVTAVAAVATFVLLWRRRFAWARVTAAAQVGFIVLGWAASQYPYLVVPDLTLRQAAASPNVLRWLLVAIGVGLITVVPSIILLLRVFQARPSEDPQR